MLIDSHCHLSSAEPFLDVFARANAAGITGCVLNAVAEADWQIITDIATTNTNIAGAIGIHPWYGATASPNWANNMCAILRDNPKLMVGEVGLDKTHENFAGQEKIFIESLEIAIEYKRVLNLH